MARALALARGGRVRHAREGAALPELYHRLFRIWFACGVPAFAAVLAILWLMVTRPEFRLL